MELLKKMNKLWTIMNELINRIKQFFNQPSKSKITIEEARSLVFFKKEISYNDMFAIFKETAFQHIRKKAKDGYIYVSILIPDWLDLDNVDVFIDELTDLGFKYHMVDELNLLIVYWK